MRFSLRENGVGEAGWLAPCGRVSRWQSWVCKVPVSGLCPVASGLDCSFLHLNRLLQLRWWRNFSIQDFRSLGNLATLSMSQQGFPEPQYKSSQPWRCVGWFPPPTLSSLFLLSSNPQKVQWILRSPDPRSWGGPSVSTLSSLQWKDTFPLTNDKLQQKQRK